MTIDGDRKNLHSQHVGLSPPIAAPGEGGASPANQGPVPVTPGLGSSFTHDEYKDLSDNVRHYNTHFLALLTIFLAIVAGLVRVVFWEGGPHTPGEKIAGCVLGLVATLCFWVQGETYLYRQRRFEGRLKELEPALGYDQYSRLIELQSGRWERGRRVGRWCWRLLFTCVAVLWVYGILHNGKWW